MLRCSSALFGRSRTPFGGSGVLPLKYKPSKGKVFLDPKGPMPETYSNRKTKEEETVAVEQEGEEVVGAGEGRDKIGSKEQLNRELGDLSGEVVWVWYPWRAAPEAPVPNLPTRRALKNLHGATFQSLSPNQKKRREEMMYGASLPPERHEKFQSNHPLLARILDDLKDQPKGFPFFYKKYLTPAAAYSTRYNIPHEMLSEYPTEMQKCFAPGVMSVKEKVRAQKAMYVERYAANDLDTMSHPVRVARLAIEAREIRNHLLHNPNNNIWKLRLHRKERSLSMALRRLRKSDFRTYWEFLREHDIMDVIQPPRSIAYRMGAYWRIDWNQGMALSTNTADFLDPKGLNGCVETGRSRAEVARDLGLSYTRVLQPNEKKALADNAVYFTKLAKFRTEQPEAYKEKKRQAFVKTFTSVFGRSTRAALDRDFPSHHRGFIRRKSNRWKSSRYGPM